MSVHQCPPEELLESYTAGTLSQVELQAVETHLAVCASCLERLDRLAEQPDPLAAALRHKGGGSPDSNPVLSEAVAAVLAGDTVAAVPVIQDVDQASQVNGYRLLDELGRGGMGRVYRALHPRLDQEVAIKLLRSSLDVAPFQARFEAERQALALMDHPHIARVFDGGVTPQGQPFFVMELVRGVAINRYCDDRRLELRRRLELFMLVCQAVQHAHQKGIIHRDLKPSNVLVAEYDGQPVPKVIDFGVAKAVDGRSAAETEFGMVVGTPEYMSPEQAGLSSQDIDTRSDVYSLGMILYELVAGDSPFGRARLHDQPVLEVLRVVREEDPPAPSSRLAAAETAVEVAAQRATVPTRLIRQVQGDLDGIVLKALEKDRKRRYETAAALAEDLRRFLNDEPVQAGPPSSWYRLRKFVRRHRGPVAAAAVVLLALLGGILGTSIGLIHASQQRAIAETERDQKQAALADLENQQAKTQAALDAESKIRRHAFAALRRVTGSGLEGQLGRQDPLGKGHREFMARLLADYEVFAQLSGDSEERRAIRAEGFFQIGMVRSRLGENVEAEAAYRQALALFRGLATEFPDSPGYPADLAKCHNNIGVLIRDQGKLNEAEAGFRRALELWTQATAKPPIEPIYFREKAKSHGNLGMVLHHLGKRQEAEAEHREAIRLCLQLGAEHPATPHWQHDLARHYDNLGAVLADVNKRKEALEEFGRGHALLKQLVAEVPEAPSYRSDLAQSYYSLGLQRRRQGKAKEAASAFRYAVALNADLAMEYPGIPLHRQQLASSRGSLGAHLREMNQAVDAEAELRQAIALEKRLVAEFPAVTDYQVLLAGSSCDLAGLRSDAGASLEALELYQDALERLTPIVEKEPRQIRPRQYLRNVHWGRAVALGRVERCREAVQDWDQAIKLSEGDLQLTLQRQRLLSLAHADPAQAVAAAEEMVKGSPSRADIRFFAARVVTLASSREADPPQRQQYADRAVALLQEARERGYFQSKANVERLDKDPDLNNLRQRDDFKKLLTELAPKSP